MLYRRLFDVIDRLFDGLASGSTPAVFERRPRVSQVAARAGVSTATVDRVINGRGGVRQQTVARVEEAIRDIVGGASIVPVAGSAQRFDVVLSGERGGATKALADAFARAAESV